jgi:hypothetical protein
MTNVLGPLGNHLALVLRHGGENVDGELVGVRVVAGDEIDASVHERGEEGDVAREPVQLSDDQLGALAFALRQRLRQLGAGGMPAAALNFGRTRQPAARSRRRGSRARRDQAYSGASSIIEMEQ